MATILPHCISEPQGTRTPADYVPPGSMRQHVGRGDSFYSVAKRLGLDPWWLVQYNFPAVGEQFSQRGAKETNWYLRHHVGCIQVTQDRKNFVFSDDQRRPFIYVPQKAPPAEEKLPLNLWFGLGLKGTPPRGWVDFIVEETGNAVLCSADDASSCFGLSTRGQRKGVRVQPIPMGTQTIALYVATGVSHPGQLSGQRVGGIDYSVSLGPLAGALQAELKLLKLGKVGAGLTELLKREKTREALHQLVLNAGIDVNSSTPKLHVIDIYSPGVEASVFQLDTTVRVDWMHLKKETRPEAE